MLNMSQEKKYWAFLVLLGVSLEVIALYYQYALGEWPCVLCIHIRIWIMAFIITAIVALLLPQKPAACRCLHLVNSVIMLGFVERSWQVLAVERGWIFADCNLDSGLPDWFTLDRWFPALFEVQTSCGYTPIIFFNISMAEILMLLSAVLLLMSAWLTIKSFVRPADDCG